MEVQTVILRCLTCLYLNWCKSYDTKCKKCKNSKNTKLSKLVNSCKNIFKSFHSFLWISQWKIEIERLNISHFKAFGMINLQYEIRIIKTLYISKLYQAKTLCQQVMVVCYQMSTNKKAAFWNMDLFLRADMGRKIYFFGYLQIS